MHEIEFRQDSGGLVGNDIRLGVNAAKVVPKVVAKEEWCLKVCQGASDWADGATSFEPCFALSHTEEERCNVGWVGWP